MAKKASVKPWLALAIIIIVIAIVWIINRPYISDVSIINLDSSTERWASLQPELKALPYPIKRFSAIDGRKMTEDQFMELGIPHLILPKFADEKYKKKRPGEIGCYLSHSTLIKQLGAKWALPNTGHIILEDDVVIDTDAAEKIQKALLSVPSDWDILCVGIGESTLDKAVGGVARVRKFWGTYGYIVRHGSIPKVSNAIKTMFDPIDEMFWQAGLNIYAMQPSVVHFKMGAFSEIHQKVN